MTDASYAPIRTTLPRLRRPLQATIALALAVSAAACGGTAGPREARTPCDLVTQEELQAILKAPLGPGIHEDDQCVYEAGGQPLRTVTLTVHWQDGREELDAARVGVTLFNRAAQAVTNDTAAPSSTLDGVGDDAFFVMAGFMPMLYARVGDRAITVESFGASQDEIVQIARTVLERIEGISR